MVATEVTPVDVAPIAPALVDVAPVDAPVVAALVVAALVVAALVVTTLAAAAPGATAPGVEARVVAELPAFLVDEAGVVCSLRRRIGAPPMLGRVNTGVLRTETSWPTAPVAIPPIAPGPPTAVGPPIPAGAFEIQGAPAERRSVKICDLEKLCTPDASV